MDPAFVVDLEAGASLEIGAFAAFGAFGASEASEVSLEIEVFEASGASGASGKGKRGVDQVATSPLVDQAGSSNEGTAKVVMRESLHWLGTSLLSCRPRLG